jgi:thymidylate kinase
LFSIDALNSRELLPAARRFLEARAKRQGGFSIWDASSIFYQLRKLDTESQASARTMVLLYAADLQFRIRWEILPALEEGQMVVAIPYVQTGVAFALATGLPRRWVMDVFRFAPKPAGSFFLNGHARTSGSPTTGFLEFCSDIVPDDFSKRFAAHFEALRRRGQCKRIEL